MSDLISSLFLDKFDIMYSQLIEDFESFVFFMTSSISEL